MLRVVSVLRFTDVLPVCLICWAYIITPGLKQSIVCLNSDSLSWTDCMHCPGLHCLSKHVCMLCCMYCKTALFKHVCRSLKMLCKECFSSIDDEECCKMHYELWIAEFREPISFWMLRAPLGYAWRFAWFNAKHFLCIDVLDCVAVSCKGQCVCIVLV